MKHDNPAPPASRDFTSRSGRRLSFTTLGFGTAPLGNLYRPIDNAQALETRSGS